MNRKFIYSLLTLASLLAVYQLYRHIHRPKLKVGKKLLQSNYVKDTPEEDPVGAQGPQYEGKQDIRSTHATQNKSFIDGIQIPRKLITIHSKGRLGNHMFQYASMLGIAYKNNLTVFITRESKVTETFHIEKVTPVYSFMRFSTSYIEYEEKRGCVFEPELLHLGSFSDIMLNGYFQSWKYFDFFDKGLREQYRWNKSIASESRRIFESLIPPEQRIYVGVHVRRGDMIFKPGYRELGTLEAGLDYILRAMNYFRTKTKNAFFIVASDDYSWCKFNIKDDDVRFAEQTVPEIDMAILTLCNHTIMTVGSFGWWTAWLTGGETVYFKDFPRPGSKLDDLFKADDYWPPSWIPM